MVTATAQSKAYASAIPFATIVNNASPSGKYGESINVAMRRSPFLFRKYTRVCAACAIV